MSRTIDRLVNPDRVTRIDRQPVMSYLITKWRSIIAMESYQLKGSAAEIYEEQKVPAIFKPLALATLDVFPLQASDDIIDVACGTGIVGREILARFYPGGSVTGVDLNEGMIRIARALTKSENGRCDWYVADVCNMPFENNVFTAAICQQGLQFFPDEDQALTEILRVLKPKARIAISVWAGASEFFLTLAEALSKHVSSDIGHQSLAPFQYSGIASLSDRMKKIGYSDIEIAEISIERVIKEPNIGIEREIMANPVGTVVAKYGEPVMQNIIQQVLGDLSHRLDGEVLRTPQISNLITAIAK